MRRLLVATVLCTAGPASAQVIMYEPNLDPDRFVLTADPQSIGLTDSARPMAFGDFALGLALRFGTPPLEVCVQQPDGSCFQDGKVITSRFGSDLVAAFGFGRVGVYAQMPVVLYQGSDFDVSGSEVSASSFGDLRLGGKVLIVDKGPHGLAFDARGIVPTGQGNGFTTDSGVSIESRAIYEHRKGRFGFAGQLGYAWREQESRLANLFVGDELLWSVGADYLVQPKLTLGAAVFGRVGLESDPAASASMGSPSYEERPTELMASMRIAATQQIAVEAGTSVNVLDGYGPLFRALVGVRWTQKREKPAPDYDWDRDRIVNVDDKCPRNPEDWDAFADEDGCPDLDNDQDKVVDKKDPCPNDPEDLDSFEDQDGCPDIDNDKDGILDTADKCPNDPEDKDGFEDEDGCPELDNDQDGLKDPDDGCPLDPEDKDSFEDADGCPEIDNDKDGLVDISDKCPDIAETYNGIDDTDGCPDSAPTVVVTNTKVEIRETVYFDLNKATIKPISFKLLDGVAAALAAHKHLNISVEGHTDDRANDDYNLKLSQRRADAVRVYLIGKGIDEKRLTAIGYGETRPAVQGKTNAARDQNRRVEFIIVNQGTPQGAAGSGSSTLPGTLPAPPTQSK